MNAILNEILLKSAVLPELKQQEILDFVSFLYEKNNKLEQNEIMLLSEQALAVDWNNSDEDKAWQKFQ
jgi:hypothetical protein